MKRKLLAILLAACAAITCTFGLAACTGESGTPSGSTENGGNTEQGGSTEPEGEHVHTYSDRVVAPTCTEKGYTLHTCDCGESYKDTYVDEKGHTFTKAQVKEEYLKSEATCTTKAIYYNSCKDCGEKGTETFEYGEILGHKFTNDVKEKYLKSEATCTTKAIYYKSCERCGEKGTETFEYGELLEHNYVNKVCTVGGEKQPSEGLEYFFDIFSSSHERGYLVAGLGTCEDTDIVIPNVYEGKPVTSIGYRAFKDCSGLTSIIIPDSVTYIEEDAFWGCEGLTSITIPDSVTSIGNSAFAGCRGIIQEENGVQYVDKWIIHCDESVTEVTLRSDTKGIADDAFYLCSGLTNITIPDSVTSIGEEAFAFCRCLTNINFSGTMVQWKAISKVSGWDNYTGNYTVICKDGKLDKNGKVINN